MQALHTELFNFIQNLSALKSKRLAKELYCEFYLQQTALNDYVQVRYKLLSDKRDCTKQWIQIAIKDLVHLQLAEKKQIGNTLFIKILTPKVNNDSRPIQDTSTEGELPEQSPIKPRPKIIKGLTFFADFQFINDDKPTEDSEEINPYIYLCDIYDEDRQYYMKSGWIGCHQHDLPLLYKLIEKDKISFVSDMQLTDDGKFYFIKKASSLVDVYKQEEIERRQALIIKEEEKRTNLEESTQKDQEISRGTPKSQSRPQQYHFKAGVFA